MIRSQVGEGDAPTGAKGREVLMVVMSESGKGVGITLFENEDAMRRGDEALDAIDPVRASSSTHQSSSSKCPWKR